MQDIHTYDPLSAGSKGLVFVGSKLLVYRRDTNTQLFPLFLDLPGGGAEGKETIYQTFEREVWEEFGLRIQPKDILYHRAYESSLEPGRTARFLVAQLPETAVDSIAFGNEGTGYLLLDPDDFISRDDAWPVLQARTVDYLRQRGK